MKLLAVLSLCALVSFTNAVSYLSEGGSDTNDCSDATTNACATFDRVMATAAAADGAIVIGSGTFNATGTFDFGTGQINSITGVDSDNTIITWNGASLAATALSLGTNAGGPIALSGFTMRDFTSTSATCSAVSLLALGGDDLNVDDLWIRDVTTVDDATTTTVEMNGANVVVDGLYCSGCPNGRFDLSADADLDVTGVTMENIVHSSIASTDAPVFRMTGGASGNTTLDTLIMRDVTAESGAEVTLYGAESSIGGVVLDDLNVNKDGIYIFGEASASGFSIDGLTASFGTYANAAGFETAPVRIDGPGADSVSVQNFFVTTTDSEIALYVEENVNVNIVGPFQIVGNTGIGVRVAENATLSTTIDDPLVHRSGGDNVVCDADATTCVPCTECSGGGRCVVSGMSDANATGNSCICEFDKEGDACELDIAPAATMVPSMVLAFALTAVTFFLQ